MSGLSQNPDPSSLNEKEAIKEIRSISHDFEYFKSLVVGNRKDLFFLDTEDKPLKEEHLRADYGLLMSHLEMYKETVSDDYPGYADFDFLKGYVQKIYQALYSEAPLTSVFETPDIQERFFTLMERYGFEGFGRKVEALIAEYRRPQPEEKPISSVLTDDEIEGLIGTFDAKGNRIK